jgi:hypothetical protein
MLFLLAIARRPGIQGVRPKPIRTAWRWIAVGSRRWRAGWATGVEQAKWM